MFLKKLLVSGCSVTHGAELYNGFMSPENIKQSFSADLAKKLNLELINVALSGGSNEYIFHSIIDALENHQDIDRVLVVWTGPTRLYWKCNNRHYFILPSWASSMVDLENFDMHDSQQNGVWITGDSDEIVQTLQHTHRFFVDHYFDNEESSKKMKHYDLCLTKLCSSLNIPYLSLNMSRIAWAWNNQPRHPTADEHLKISNYIYNTFYKLD